ALQEELDRSASSGADTSETTQRLAAVQKEISQTRTAVADLSRQQKTSADAQAAWNGQLGESRVMLTGMRDGLSSVSQAGTSAMSGLRAGTDSSTKGLLRLAASVDEISGKMLDLARAESRMENFKAS
ncbi:hypothetical protein, partial [Gluconobacter sp. Gdi]|uniref:hypothetical protein n=1 Tax=Gluconobacter sp. Gdi TaxID=2691888 RepID=UPI00192106B1